MPGLVGVEALHALEDLQAIRSQVLFVNDSVVADDERLDPCDSILGRYGGQGKSTDHGSLNDKVQLSQGRRGTLTLQNLEVVAVIRLSFIRIALRQGLGDPLSDGTAPRAIRVLPRQPIVFPRGADDPLGVLVHLGIIVLLLSVFVLRFHEPAADLDSIQFVTSDAPQQNFIAANLGIEIPLSLALDDRNWKRPILITYRNDGAI